MFPRFLFSFTSTSMISSILTLFSKSNVVVRTVPSPIDPYRLFNMMLFEETVVGATVGCCGRRAFIPPFPNIKGNSKPVAELTTLPFPPQRTRPVRRASSNSLHSRRTCSRESQNIQYRGRGGRFAGADDVGLAPEVEPCAVA